MSSVEQLSAGCCSNNVGTGSSPIAVSVRP